MSTVLQKAIEKVSVEISKLESTNRTSFGDGFLSAWREAKEHLESLLPEEEKQIREAWTAARLSTHKRAYMFDSSHGFGPEIRVDSSKIEADLETYITNLKKQKL